jgi:hypothetical protein
VRNYLVVIAVDLLLLVSIVYVLEDLQWRAAYAASAHGHTAGYTPSFSYSFFTQVFTMSRGGASLSSPLTLDWIQLLGIALVLLNGWLLYSTYTKRRRGSIARSPTST